MRTMLEAAIGIGLLATAGCATATTAPGTDVSAPPPHTPQTAHRPTTPRSAVPHDRRLPESDRPVPRGCVAGAGPTVTITLTPKGPDPHCLVATSDQRLRVLNASAEPQPGYSILVQFAALPQRDVPAGEATLFDRPFGDLLYPGIHSVDLFDGTFQTSAILWLDPGMNLGAETRCADLPPLPSDTEIDTVLAFESGQDRISYWDQTAGKERTFILNFRDDLTCRTRADAAAVINHDLETAGYPPMQP